MRSSVAVVAVLLDGFAPAHAQTGAEMPSSPTDAVVPASAPPAAAELTAGSAGHDGSSTVASPPSPTAEVDSGSRTAGSQSLAADIGAGLDLGAWGGTFGASVRLSLPFAEWGAVILRATSLNELRERRHDLGCRVELRGQSAIIWDLVRTYGGIGLQLFVPVRDDMYGGTARGFSWGGGAYLGVEIFTRRYLSWFVEIGGHRGSEPYWPKSPRSHWASGGMAVAGLMFYPFRTE